MYIYICMFTYIYIYTYTCVPSLILWFALSPFVSLSHCHNAGYWFLMGVVFNNVLIFFLVRTCTVGTCMRCKHMHANMSTYIHTHMYIHAYVYWYIFVHISSSFFLSFFPLTVGLIAVLLPAVGIEPTSRYQRTFLRRKTYTTRPLKYLSNSISTSVTERYKSSVVRRFFGTATLVRFPAPVKGLRS